MIEVGIGIFIGYSISRFKTSVAAWFKRAEKKVEEAIDQSAH